MIKVLRKKFIIITMLYLLAVLTVLYIADRLYIEYWYDMDGLSLLEWVAASGELFETEKISEEISPSTEEIQDNPISGCIVDKDGTVRLRRYLDSNAKVEIPDSVIERIMAQPKENYKVDHYIYIRKPLNDGSTMLVLMDTTFHENMFIRAAYTILIVAVGVLILFAITFYLSRYVTEPARKALEREKQFVSDASHELKTPLGAISVNAEALEMDENNIIYIKNILSETARMNRLVERLLTLSRIEEGVAEKKEPILLSEVLEEMILTYESVAFDKGVTLKYEIGEEITIKGDEDEIRQLIVILLDNAIKNCNDKGEVTVSLSEGRGGLYLKVSNTGSIIAQEDLEHIFDRFYTADKSRNGNSFGLGLSIAKAIVTRHNGSIEAVSSEAEGTVFTIIFKS